jgi:hypothetical protein
MGAPRAGPARHHRSDCRRPALARLGSGSAAEAGDRGRMGPTGLARGHARCSVAGVGRAGSNGGSARSAGGHPDLGEPAAPIGSGHCADMGIARLGSAGCSCSVVGSARCRSGSGGRTGTARRLVGCSGGTSSGVGRSSSRRAG